MKQKADFVLHNLECAVLYTNLYKGKGTKAGWNVEELKTASVASKDGKIVWVGNAAELTANVEILPDTRFYNGEGLTALPGFVDSHTHLVYGGNRADEFEMRVQGKTYLEILEAGGGILRKVKRWR
jgi:imidazolonepropionase